MNITDLNARIASTFDSKEPVEERVVSSQGKVIYFVDLDKEKREEKENQEISEIAFMSTTDYHDNLAYYKKGDCNIRFVLKSGTKKSVSLLDNNIGNFEKFSALFEFIGERFDFNFEEFCNYYNL